MVFDKNSIILLSYYIIFIIAGSILMYIDWKKFYSDDDGSFFYGSLSKRTIVEEKSIVDSLSVVLAKIGFAIIILIVGCGIGSSGVLRQYWNGTGVYVDELSNIMFNMWIALMGVLIVLVSFVKKTWLTFTADDIVKKFKIKDEMVGMGWCILTGSILNFFKPIFMSQFKYQWYFGTRFLTVAIFIYFLWRFYKVCKLLVECFFGDQMEKLFLDSLYEEFWYNPIKKRVKEDKWQDDDTIKGCTNYLVEKYLFFLKKIQLEKIHKIGFATNLYTGNEKYKKKRHKRVKKRSVLCITGISVGFTMLSLFLTGISEYMEKTISLQQYVISGIICIGVVLIVSIVSGMFIKPFTMFAITLIHGRYCYEINYKKDSSRIIKTRYIREVSIWENSVYFKYVHYMKSLIAFYLIAPDDAQKTIFNELSQKCVYIVNKSKICLPIIVLDYLHYLDSDEKELLPYYIQMDESELIKDLTRAFCLDIGRRCYECNVEEGVTKFKKYIDRRKVENKRYKGIS